MSTQAPAPAQNQPPRSHNYFIGIAIGLIPLLLAIVSVGIINMPVGVYLFYAAIALYVITLIASLVCLGLQRVRFIGYGLLTMVFVTPVVYYIACIVAVSRPRG
jgi:hypothetical protein